MIIEVAVIGLISVLFGLTAYVATGRYLKNLGVKRLLESSGVEGRVGDKKLRVGLYFIRLLPTTLSQPLVVRADKDIAKRIVAAGIKDFDVRDYVGLQMLAFIGGIWSGLFLVGGWPGLGSGLLLGAGLSRLPGYQIDTKARVRRLEFARLLPDFIDMLAIGVDAGLSLDRAIHIYNEKFSNAISEVFVQAVDAIEVGEPRRAAFKAVIEKTRCDSIEWFVSAILQSEKLGSPLAGTLREYAIQSRGRQKELVRELTAIAPVKMLFPIAGLILPALMIVILGPAFLQFMQ